MAMQANDSPTGFRFEGRYTEADMDALARFTVSQVLDRRIGRATLSATVLFMAGAVLARSWVVAIAGFLAILGSSALVRYVILPRRLLRHAQALPGLSSLRVISVDAQGIRHQAEGHEVVFSLEAIRRLALHRAHLFVLLKPRGCLMLPLAWIQAPATAGDVVKLLVRR